MQSDSPPSERHQLLATAGLFLLAATVVPVLAAPLVVFGLGIAAHAIWPNR